MLLAISMAVVALRVLAYLWSGNVNLDHAFQEVIPLRNQGFKDTQESASQKVVRTTVR